jgi:hypothetical protein
MSTGQTERMFGTLGAVGYRGKVAEQERARALRAQAWTLQEIATELGVSISTRWSCTGPR